ncbi:MAG: addiction module antidote protein, HigA family [Mesorhizobium sp.]|uniref:HigA family addiction module antitoxin n=1 Tax=Mesorhizobium sp. TaxID=1871066 RepID=UPI000FE45CCD|nr:HigA family addiction module antitoxin [Mesorhizobium sp.]RWF44695.1 MAG: addiction module antidote protein, HigA family [Mesorhizobium sp.]
MVLGATARRESWTPDWAVHPGEHLAEYIESRGWSQAEFGRLADLSPKLVSTIVNGTNPVTAETALKLERVLGMRASIWTGLQADWDLYQARQAKGAEETNAETFISNFPVAELKSRGVLPDTKDPSKILDGLLEFFSIGSPRALRARMANLAVHHRQSKAFQTNPNHVATWLLLGEHRARALNLPAFNFERFSSAVREVRNLTVHDPEVFYPSTVELCRQAGVGFVLEKPISKTCLFGSARWIDNDRAIIQMSLRMKTNDHFWWTFFHEAAHVALHRGKTFADDMGGVGDGLEGQADAWAEEVLVGSRAFKEFVATSPRSERAVQAFASDIGIHPGIVVGMLQHRHVIPFTHLNRLKARFAWKDEL